MENSKLNELEIRLNEEMEKDAEEIDVEKLKRLLDQIGEHSLTNDQKQELSLISTRERSAFLPTPTTAIAAIWTGTFYRTLVIR